MLGIDEESGMAIEIDEGDVMAIPDSAKELRSLELKRDALNVDINWAADVYMAVIDKRIVTREAESLRNKWYKLIDTRREVDLQIKQAKAEIIANALGAL